MAVATAGSGASAGVSSGANVTYGSTTTTATTTSTSHKPTAQELQAAYEVYLCKKQVDECAVAQQAPYDAVMKAFNESQAAKKRYLELKAAASR